MFNLMRHNLNLEADYLYISTDMQLDEYILHCFSFFLN